jgi:hypothetical protein
VTRCNTARIKTSSGKIVFIAQCIGPLTEPEERSVEEPMSEYTPYQQKIIKRYYDNQDTIQRQRLAELVGELYLSEGKKRKRLWESAAAAMQKLGVPQARIDHLLKQQNPVLVAEVVKEFESR